MSLDPMMTHVHLHLTLQPQDAYGLEKLASEELCKHYGTDFGIEVRIARFHNIYGPYGTWKGGREKAPAAFCRKVLTSTEEIEMWGDGKQTRSFTFIDDCVEGILRITKSDFKEPLNLGSTEMVRFASSTTTRPSLRDGNGWTVHVRETGKMVLCTWDS